MLAHARRAASILLAAWPSLSWPVGAPAPVAGPGEPRPVAPVAGTVYRVQGRRGQQARALGQDRRVHEARGGGLRPRPLPRARKDRRRATRSSRSRSRSPETLKNLDRYKQLERRLYFQGGAPERARARRDLPPGQGRRAHHLQRRTRPRSAATQMALELVPPARHRRFAGREEDSRQRHRAARAERESRRPDHGDRLVQPEPRHALRVEPAAVPVSPVRRPRQQPRHVHVHAEGKPVHGAARLARLVSDASGSTSTRWARTARAFS